MKKDFTAIYRTAQTLVLILSLVLTGTMFYSCSDGMEDVPSTYTPVEPTPDPDPDLPTLKLEDSSLELNYKAEAALYHAIASDSLISSVRLEHMEGETVVLDTVYKRNPWFDVDVKAKEQKEILVSSLSALKVTSDLALTASDPTVTNVDGYYDRKIIYTGTFTIGTDDGEKSQYEVLIDNQDFSKFFSAEQAVLQLSYAPFVAGDVVVLGENKEMKRDSIEVDGKKYYLVPMNLTFKSYRNKVDASTSVTTRSAESFLMEQGRSTAAATTKSTRGSVIADYVHDANFTAIVKVAAENGGGITPEPEEELLNYNNVRKNYNILPNSPGGLAGKVRSTDIVNTQWRIAADRDSTFTMLENYSGYKPADLHITLGIGKSASITDKEVSKYPDTDVQGNRTYNHLKNWYTFKINGVKYEGDYGFNWVSGYYNIVTEANKPAGDNVWFATPTATMSDNATYELVSSDVDVEISGKNYKRTIYNEIVKVVFGGDYGTENVSMIRKITIDVEQETAPEPTNNIVRRTFKREVHELEKANKRVKSYAIYEIEREDGTVKDTIPHAPVYTSYSMIAPALQEFIQNSHGFSYVSIANNDAVTGLAHNLTSTYTFKLNDGTTFTTPFILNYSDAGTVTVFAGTEWELEYTFNPTPASQKWNGTVDGSVGTVGDYQVQGFTVNNLVSLANGTDNNSCKVNTKVEDIINPEKGRLVRHIQRTLSSSNQVASKLFIVDIIEWEKGFDIYADGGFQKYWKKSDLDPAMISLFHTATSRGPNGDWFPAVISVYSASNEGYWKYAGKDVNGTEYLSTFAYKAYNYASDAWAVKGVTSEFVGDNLVIKQNGTVVLTVSRR